MIEFTIPVEPHPASRPKVNRYGVTYSKGHLRYQREFFQWYQSLPEPPLVEPFAKPTVLAVTMIFRCTKPPTSRLSTPRYDIDNLVKLPLDCMTKTGAFWDDDSQIEMLVAYKVFEPEPGTTVQISEINRPEEGP